MGLPILQTAPHKRPIVTYLLILVNFTVFIMIVVAPDIIVPGAISTADAQRELAMIPIEIVRGERLWTVFTAMFVHADLGHILGNMLFLFLFGRSVESAMGRTRFLEFYFLSGVFATIFHIISISFIPPEYLVSTSQFILNPWVTPTLGASGAISGVLAAYLIFYPESRITSIIPIGFIPLILVLPAWAFIFIWFIYQLIMGILSLLGTFSSVAFWAHIGGFVAGMATAPLFMDPKLKKLIAEFREVFSRLTEYYSELYRGEELDEYY